jgi:sphingomyelin phosphodiesterase
MGYYSTHVLLSCLVLFFIIPAQCYTNQDDFECIACKGAFEFLDSYLAAYGNDILQYVQPICTVIAPYLNSLIGEVECNPQEPQTCIDLCKGMITSWGPVIADVFVSLELDPAVTCGKLEICPPINGSTPPVYPKTKLSPSGTIPNPSKGTIFHVSDIHYDRNYAPNTNTNCEMPVCCHVTYGTGPSKPLGDFSCDVPELLVKDMLNQIKNFTPNYMIYTGDTPAHDLWLQTHDTNVGAIINVTTWTLDALPASTKYFPTLGNHAGAPVDNFGGPLFDAWLYGPVGDLWSKFLPNSAIVSFKWGGYYVALMEPGLWVIALQTNYYDDSNLWLDSIVEKDISGQFAWFADVLSQIASFGEKAIVIAHEKPKSFKTPGPWQQWYLNLATQYKDVIKGHFFGHNHCDLFNVLHDPASNGTVPIAVALMPSSLTPVSNDSNPSFRIIDYDQKTKTILDYHQYRTDLALDNIKGYYTWEKAYSALADWHIPDMSPKSWQSVGERIGSNVTDWTFFRFQYHGGLKYYPFEGLDTNQKVAKCSVLGDTDITYTLCMKQ